MAGFTSFSVKHISMTKEIPRNAASAAADPCDPEGLARDIARLRGDLADAVSEARLATALFGAPEPVTIADLDTALAYLQLTPLPRGADRRAFTDDAWRDMPGLTALIRAGQHLTQTRNRALMTFTAAGLVADYTAIHADIATKSDRPLRFLDGAYKRNIARLCAYLNAPLPKARGDRLKIIGLATGLRAAEGDFASREAQGRAFGTLWRGAGSDWGALDNVLRWRQSHGNLPPAAWPRLAAASEADLAAGDRARRALYAALSAWRSGMDAVVTRHGLDPAHAIGPVHGPIRALDARYAAWLDRPNA